MMVWFHRRASWTTWITLIYFWNIIISYSRGDWSWGDVDSRTEMACENYPISMRCPGHDVIQIVTAIYGRQSTDKCSASASETENINCYLPDAKTITEEKCNNKTFCSFRVSGETFSDPCPGTKKYLETKFKCVRYMFACPGFLTGIGKETISTIDVRPQPGIWTKDSFYNTDHVFFGSSGNTVTEYSTWENFENGNALTHYTLPHNMAQGNLVVDDRNLYFVKDDSRSVIKYSLITRRSTKQILIPGPRGGSGMQGNDISLAVDENGLWVVYTRGKGMITFSKLDKDQLKITKMWTINRRVAESKYSFFICGVFYSVNSNTGKVDYSYNTNLKSNQEKRGLDLEFDEVAPLHQSSRHKTREKSFLGYDASSLTYNPHDQLLYMWDATDGNAILFKLNFDGKNPSKARPTVVPTTTTKVSTTTTTTRRNARTTTTTVTSESETTAYVPQTSVEIYPPEVYEQDYCHKITRNGLDWPLTRFGEVAKRRCLDGQGGFAKWKCVRESSMFQPDWHVAGPDLSDCITWASDIASDYKSGLIDRATAFDSLATEIDENDKLDSKSVQAATDFVDKLFEDTTLPSQENAKKIAESVASISSNILSHEDSMENLSTEKQVKVAETLMNSTEKAGFVYAETVALTPVASRNRDPLVISKADVLLRVEVREKSYDRLTSSGVTSFPDERTCTSGSQICGSDSISIHDADILGQKGEGPAIVVFSLYNNIGEYLLSSDSGWEVDSNVISATFQEPGFRATLNHPATIVLKHNTTSRFPHRCVFWDHSVSSYGNWSDVGCSMLETNQTHTTCQCDHLTSFAVLVNHQGVSMEPYHRNSLDIITKVGISISIVCLILCVLTFTCFRNLYNDRNTVHTHLCICLLVAEVVFLVGIDKTENATACSVVAGLLHYFFLAAFLWMALEGFQLYVLLVEVFEETSRWKWYYMAGYGIPAIIVGISAAVGSEGYGTEEVCWLQIDSGIIWSFVGPILIIILVNLGFLAMTVYKMYVHTMAFTDTGKINSIKASVRGASVLLCLLGITWAFGILWINEDMAVLAYLFCIFNAFQGMFIFIFHCLLARKVRAEYSRCFSRFPCCRKLGGDLYVANSSSFQKQYTRGRFGASANGSASQHTQQSQLQRMWHETVAPRNSESTPVTSEVPQNRDQVRPLKEASSRNMNQNSQVDRSYTQEDEVFLPPENGQCNGNTADSPMGDFHYDRLQHHHHHPDDYSVFHGEAQPMGHYNTGQVPKSNPHQSRPARESTKQHSRTNYGQFGPKSMSHSKVQDILIHNNDEVYLQERPSHNVGPGRWDSNRVQSHAYRRSLDENYIGKRDSGISLQRPPSNSRIIENTPPGGQPRNPMYRRSVENTLGDRRIEDFEHPVKGRSNFSDRNSLDDENRQRFACDNHRRSATLDPASVPRCPIHHNIGVPLMGIRNKGSQPPNGHRRHKSLSSDSDDPIVTDCSVSSAGSSFGHQPPVMSHHNNNSSYYEEPICHKRRLPDTAQMMAKHREHWHGRSDISEQNRDENDLEVELITSSDNSIEANPGTLGYPSYRPPSPPRSEDDSSATASGGRSAISEISAYQKQGMAITQHKDTYGKPSPVDRRLKNTNNHMNGRHPDEIIDAQGRTLSNI